VDIKEIKENNSQNQTQREIHLVQVLMKRKVQSVSHQKIRR
jgi:hypothetical protein